jgi:hypothetical protein
MLVLPLPLPLLLLLTFQLKQQPISCSARLQMWEAAVLEAVVDRSLL